MNKGIYNLPKSRTYKTGYKVYTALLSQIGTHPPSAIVLENTIGDVWLTYVTTGQYAINTNSLFTDLRTAIFHKSIPNDDSALTFMSIIGSTSQILLITTSDGTTSDDILSNIAIEIRVYY